MIRKCYIYHCDICGSEQMLCCSPETENSGWSAFSIVPANRRFDSVDEYSLICPDSFGLAQKTGGGGAGWLTK